MGQYLKGPAEILTRLYPQHNFHRDARVLAGGLLLIEPAAWENPTSPLESEPSVLTLTHAEALQEVEVLRAASAPPPGDEDDDDDAEEVGA